MKHVILWGVSAASQFEASQDPSVVGIVDSNTELAGSKKFGLSVFSPDDIIWEDVAKVIICTSSIKDVMETLAEFSVDTQKVQISSFLRDHKDIFHLEQISCKGYFSSGLPSATKSLSGGGIYFFEVVNGQLETLKKVFTGNTHGMIISGEKLIFACQGQGIVHLNVHDNLITSVLNLKDGLRPHGVRIEGKSTFVACSSADRVLELDVHGQVINEFLIGKSSELGDLAQHHCNDLFVTKQHIYVSMFSISGTWRLGNFDGGIVRICRENKTITTIKDRLKMPHNIVLHDDELWFLNSYVGEVIGYDGKVISQLNGFVRGFTSFENYIVVGESKNRNVSKLSRGNLTASLDTSLTIIDPKINACLRIPIPRPISEIHSIAMLED